MQKRDLFFGIAVGFCVGLALAAALGGTVSWFSLAKRQKELVAQLGEASMAVIAIEPLPAGQDIKAYQLAQRPVPNLVISRNTVLPGEAGELAGKKPVIGFDRGDLLLRSAFGLPPRE